MHATRAGRAIERALRQGVPAESPALYARWWQLESWLREVLYLELVALFGPAWRDEVDAKFLDYMAKDDLVHMQSADNSALITYTDFGFVLSAINDHYWDQMSYALLDRDVWLGRAKELRGIRNRMAHCRRPHASDLARLEQTLSDLEHGAFESYASMKRWVHVSRSDINPALYPWFTQDHDDRDGLINHADAQYHTRIRVGYSRRPSATSGVPVGRASYLYHIKIHVGSGTVRARDVWDQLSRFQDDLAFVLIDQYSVEVILPALLNPQRLADASHQSLVAVLQSLDRLEEPSVDEGDGWHRRQGDLDWRVKTRTGWNIVDDTTVPITIFDANTEGQP